MNFINKIEIQGRIGNIRIAELSSGTVASFSVVTDYLFRTADGNAVCETTWFNASAFQRSCGTVDLKSLRKGAIVHLTGRMRSSKYTTAEGIDKHFYEIIASEVELINED